MNRDVIVRLATFHSQSRRLLRNAGEDWLFEFSVSGLEKFAQSIRILVETEMRAKDNNPCPATVQPVLD